MAGNDDFMSFRYALSNVLFVTSPETYKKYRFSWPWLTPASDKKVFFGFAPESSSVPPAAPEAVPVSSHFQFPKLNSG